MSEHKPLHVAESELIARIDRKLAPSGMAIYRKSGAAGGGRYDIVEVATNHLVRQDVPLEDLAREVGALGDEESLGA